MTNFHRVLLVATCFGLLAALAGCSPQPAATTDSPSASDVPAVVISPQQPVAAIGATEAKPQPKAEPPAPPAPPPTFPFPSDLGGKAVAKTVTPDSTRPLSNKGLGDTPKTRTVPAKVLEPGAITHASHAPPPLLPAKPGAVKPANPNEKVPLNLGEGAYGVPTKLVLPVAAVDTPRARDVNLPPSPPTLGRQTTDRVGFDDPTSDFGNAVVVSESVKVPLASSSFLKIVVPDPFELGTQVKPKVPPTAEPSPAPVTIEPQRVK